MAIHEQVLTQQSLLDFFAQMKDEDRKKQEKEEIIAEYKYKMDLEKKKREKSDYIIQLIKQGYSVDKAEQEVNRKFVDVLV